MSTELSVITQKDLIKGVSWLPETTTAGTIETSGTMNWFGPIVRFSPTHGRSKLESPGAGLEDLRSISYPGGKIGSTTIAFKVINTGMIYYLTRRNEGAGTTSYPISLAAEINVHGTTKYWLAEFARPGFGLLSSGRDQEIIALGTFAHKYDRPLNASWTSKPTMATDPGETSYPVWKFSDGGTNPVLWDSDGLDCEAIRIMVDKQPLIRTSAGGDTLRINKCNARRIRWRMTVGNDSYAQNLIDDHANGNVKDIVWTLQKAYGSGTANTKVVELTLTDCGVDPIPEEFLTAEENSEVLLNLSGTAKNLNWSPYATLSSSFSIS